MRKLSPCNERLVNGMDPKDTEGAIETLGEEIAALNAGIKAFGTEQRPSTLLISNETTLLLKRISTIFLINAGFL